jgi:hypothetical protein
VLTDADADAFLAALPAIASVAAETVTSAADPAPADRKVGR